MNKRTDPSLQRIYACDDEDIILYIDETYSTQEEERNETFYVLAASMYKKGDLDSLRGGLEDIVGGDYWHSSEAMQTAQGREKFVAMLAYFSHYGDASILTCKTPIPPPKKPQKGGHAFATPHVELARKDCLTELLTWAVQEIDHLAGIVFERRTEEKDNNRDRQVLKHLAKDGIIPENLARAWVSPSQERALWVPDTVCAAYRRTRTHTDETASYFFDYLDRTVQVREF